MARTSPLWRRLGAAFAALVVAVFALGSSLDSMVCRDEGPLGVAVASLHADTTVASNHADAAGERHPADGMPCVHGHCHHAGAYTPANLVEASAPAEHPGDLLFAIADRDPPSSVTDGLKRPPRA